MKGKKIDINNLTQEQFEGIMNALIVLKQTNPNKEVWFNEKGINYILNILKNN
tara:strand:+ start:66 stop:224 length:159 start_codon:yes stop_codon:yes gene_type:complete